MRLDIGGRVNAPEGWRTLDKKGPADYILDLEGSLAPAGYGQWEKIRAHHVLEHIRNLCPLMDELWMLLTPGGELDIEVPCFPHGASVVDPTHVRFFIPETFDYFVRLKYFGYVNHYWEWGKEPEIVGANKDCISVILRKPL